jgi:Flp pilus assembly protein TadG
VRGFHAKPGSERKVVKRNIKSTPRLMSALFAGIGALISTFRADRRGNTAIIFALSALPLVSAIGCVADYSYASMIKTKLQAAADAAALATVSNNSPIVVTAKSMSGNGTVSGGPTYIQNFFSADTTSFSGVSATGTTTKSGMTVTATLSYSYGVPTTFMKVLGYPTITLSGSSTASVTVATYISFYLMLDVSGSMSFPSTTAEQVRLMSVNPDNLHPSNSPPNNGYPQGCQFACHWATQNTTCQNHTNPQTSTPGPWQGSWPPAPQQYPNSTFPITSQWPSGYPGGYCQGFLISRLGTTPAYPTNCVPSNQTPPATNTNDSNTPSAPSGRIPGTTTAYPPGCGQYVNWTNPQVSSCPNPGTTSCIQLRADAVGYAVTALLQQAQSTETYTGISNQFSVGLYPFIVNLCTSAAGSSNSCSVGQTTSLTGSTITNFAQELASLLDNGGVGSANSTLGSGGTHFENALHSMNSFITSVGTGGSASNPLPYVFIITDGSQDYQTQSGGSWGSQNWTANASVPHQNSATVIPPNSEQSTDYCGTMKSRGITVAVLYIPYETIQDANSAFASDEDGYANSNIQNIPGALQACASPNFYFTATTPQDIQNALIQMFQQSLISAHVSH